MRKLVVYLLPLLAIVFLGGCAAQIQKEYDEAQARMRTWVGATSGELVARRGAPDSSYRLEAGKVAYAYKYEWTTGSHGEKKFSCAATYIVSDDGIIIDASFRWQSVFGNNVCGMPPTRY